MNEIIQINVEPHVLELIAAAAELEGQSVAEFFIAAAKARAEIKLYQQEIIPLVQADQRRFSEAILDPPSLNEAMKEALTLHNEFIEK